MAIAADGSIYFCSSLADAPEFKMGDVFAGIDREKQQHFDTQFNVNNRPECKTCWARNSVWWWMPLGCAHDDR